MRSYSYILMGILATALVLAGCNDDIASSVLDDDGAIKAGEEVLFTSYVPSRAVTRSDAEDAFYAKMAKYQPVTQNYKINVTMYEEGVGELGSCLYFLKKTPDAYGTLEPASKAAHDQNAKRLYWPGNAKKYGFKATAGSSTLMENQTTEARLTDQDLLEGYGFEPLWNTGTETAMYDEDGLNYLTSKQWYAANKTQGLPPVLNGVTATDDYKKIPLYMKHKRSKITIRLKAGEGVERSALSFDHAVGAEDGDGHISTTVYSYAGGTHQEIQPLASRATVDYTTSDYGTPAAGVETTEYTCIVEPHDYLTGATTEPIARINLSSQHFTFYASNDFLYKDYQETTAENHADALDHMEHYNLQPGQHLVITATLGRGSRKILITAYVEDWTEVVTTSIVDDYGKSGEPIQINTRQELYDFLRSDKNKPGSVAIIVPNSLNLESGEAWSYNQDNDQDNDLDLWCTLNLAGATLRTDHQIFKTIHPMGNIVNGTISVGNVTVPAAIAETSVGTLERVSVLPRDASGNNSTGKASRAGLVITNSGTISQCSSELPVYGTYDPTPGSTKNIVGGLAAYSVYSEENGSTMPVIDGCTVNVRVDGEVLLGADGNAYAGVQGAGLVGAAVGRVTNSTFVYGRTLLQNATYFKNTIHHKYDDSVVEGGDVTFAGHDLRAYGNAWPTTASANGYGIPETNTNNADAKYNEVIDSQVELSALLSSTYNNSGSKYRLSGDFTVTKAATAANNNNGWTYGQSHNYTDGTATGNVFFELEGNNHVITTDAMLFSNIQNSISNLTIRLGGNLIATSSTGGAPLGQESIAPLGYSVSNGANLTNIQVKGGDYRIQAPVAAGIVVWAYGDAVVQDCQSKVNIQSWVPGTVSDEARIYLGGIVAEAAHATITRCVFHGTDGTLFKNTSADYTQAGTDTDDHSANIYFGGILGGTVRKNDANEKPSVLITDCTSWLSTTGSQYKGAIVGYARYADPDNGNALTNGTITGDDGCQGNWWNTNSSPIGTGKDGMSPEEIIGRRNAVTPTQNANY